MRLLHTSDWHLGHRLHGVLREREHAQFLRWLLMRLVEEEVDALIIAGDIFDTANPSAEAQRTFYRFLAACLRRLPALDIVIIGGNHDSPARLDAAAEILRPLRVHVLGALPRDDDGEIDLDRAVLPLHDARGEVAAQLIAVPYLRPTDWLGSATGMPLGSETPRDDSTSAQQLLDSLRRLYDSLFSAARARRQPQQALLCVSHAFLHGGAVSIDSERRIQLGNSLPMPSDLFPNDLAYVALGHLHKAQRVESGEHGHLRYSGSPIPLSFSERTYAHQVVIVDLDGPTLAEVRPLLIPRSREMLSIPEKAAPLDEVLTLLRALPRENADGERPLLEVRVRLDDGPQPLLRTTIEEALGGAPVQLLRIVSESAAAKNAQPLETSETPLLDLHPEEVLTRLYQRTVADPQARVPEAQLLLFRRLLEQVEGDSPTAGAP